MAEYCREHGLGLSRGTVARLVPEEERSSESEAAVKQTPRRSNARRPVGQCDGGGSRPRSASHSGSRSGGNGARNPCRDLRLVWRGLSVRRRRLARGHLEVVDQAVLGAASREPVYVTVVENDDPRRAALGVAPRLTVDGSHRVSSLARSGRFDQPANVPPGGVAVAVDRLPVVPSGALRQPRFHVAAFRRAPKFPIEPVVARLDRSDCTLTAEVTASQRLRDLRLIGLARRNGRIAGGGAFRVGSVPRGRSTHELGRPGFGSCGAAPPRWSLYPALAPSHGKWRG